jgi:hypothetical protein
MCVESSECAAEMPLCEAGDCVACGDGVETSCAADYPDTPICDTSGQCVECTDEDVSACAPETPTCEANVCVPCREHEQCPDSACNMATGACMPVDNVWWVDNTAPGGDGSEMDPFNAFGPALVAVEAAGGEGTIFASGSGGNYLSPITINPGQTIAIIGDDAVTLSVAGQAVLVDSGAVGMLSGIRVIGGTSGVNCQGGQVWLDKVVVLDSIGMVGGGIVANGGDIVLRNSFIGGNSSTAPAALVGQGTISILYSTLATGIDAPAVECLLDGANVIIRNSVVVSRSGTDETQSCAGANITTSALEMPIVGNTDLPTMTDTSWFQNFNAGNFRLSGTQPAEISTAAIWLTGDPSTDIDGNPRPTIDGMLDHAGADVP